MTRQYASPACSMPEVEDGPHCLCWKRVYDPESPDDGTRILIDRLWPRGIKKEKLHLDLWLKEIAPSTELRKWFAHDPARWEEFQRRYQAELHQLPEALAVLREKISKRRVTLLTATKDPQYNHAIVLIAFLTKTDS